MSSEHHYCDYNFGGEDFPSSSPIQPLANNRITHHEIESLTELPNKPIVTPEEELVIKKFFEANPNLMGQSPATPGAGIKEIFRVEDAWIQTYSGKKFFPLNPSLDSICIEDIAHALSMQCRFTGHTKFHYSVAQHSVLVSLNCDKSLALYGLLHDASEAYISDISSPIKRTSAFEPYKKIEKHLQAMIFNKFGLESSEPAHIKEIDLKMLATEARDLFPTPHPEWKLNIQPYDFTISQLSPRAAKYYFLHRFYELTDI